MSNRAAIQDAHERAVLNAAVGEHNRIQGLNLSVVSRPDPPDAILSDGNTTTWLELTDAFFSSDWARDLVSYAADEKHRPMQGGMYVDMDAQLASVLCDLVCRKAAKDSYKPFVAEYGPGILVVGIESPWLDDDTIRDIDREWAERGRPDISGTFTHVYLGYRDDNGNRVLAWPHS